MKTYTDEAFYEVSKRNNMEIQKQPTDIVVTFSPKHYWLRQNKCDPEWHGEYCLTHRIDMSYAGKEDQEGPLAIFLREEQAQTFKEAGFDEISGGIDPSELMNKK